MKHYLLIFFATLIALTASLPLKAYNVPYESDFNDDDWTIVNVEEGSLTWYKDNTSSTFSVSGYSKGLTYKYDGKHAADDWAISSPIHLEADKEYKVIHWGRRHRADYADHYDLYWGNSSDPEELKTNGTMLLEGSNLPTVMTKFVYIIKPTVTGDYYFGFHANMPEDLYYVYITGFKVTENISLPGAVTAPKVTPGAEGALSAILSWTWPTLDEDGVE